MKLFIFTNIIGNYCSGDYYFIATDVDQAKTMQSAFAEDHNRRVNNNTNYIIEFDEEEYTECEIKPGFFPINRIQLHVKK
jgi:hypothetical protein